MSLSQVVVVILATLVTYLFDWENTAGVKVLGKIPSGLPAPSVPSFPTVSHSPVARRRLIIL